MRNIERWEEIAWILAADDMKRDVPRRWDFSDEAQTFREMAVMAHGAEAKRYLVIVEAIRATEPSSEHDLDAAFTQINDLWRALSEAGIS